MTVDEVEQGLRNLVASQPMIMAGPNGGAVNGMLFAIDSIKNLRFRIQTYPYQDSLKMSLVSDLANMENNFVNNCFKVMYEKGINLGLYINAFSNAYGPVQYGAITPNMVMGQMSYNPMPTAPVFAFAEQEQPKTPERVEENQTAKAPLQEEEVKQTLASDQAEGDNETEEETLMSAKKIKPPEVNILLKSPSGLARRRANKFSSAPTMRETEPEPEPKPETPKKAKAPTKKKTLRKRMHRLDPL